MSTCHSLDLHASPPNSRARPVASPWLHMSIRTAFDQRQQAPHCPTRIENRRRERSAPAAAPVHQRPPPARRGRPQHPTRPCRWLQRISLTNCHLQAMPRRRPTEVMSAEDRHDDDVVGASKSMPSDQWDDAQRMRASTHDSSDGPELKF